MFLASILSHVAFGALLALIFVLYYINGDGKWKIYLEILIGLGGSSGCIFILDKMFKIDDDMIRMYSIAACIFTFLGVTFILLVIIAFVMRDKDEKDIIRLRDILLGQNSWINYYYNKRAKEIDNKLGIPILEKRENELNERERIQVEQLKHIQEEQRQLDIIGNKKLHLELPERKKIILTKDYINVMPSYIKDIFNCTNSINDFTKLYISDLEEKKNVDFTNLKSYFISVATYISNEIFGGNSKDVRVHFRYYNRDTKCYEKLVAIIGNQIVTKNMTPIPYEDDSMIKKSYECKRALIKSINIDHDYKSNNYTTWQDYMTYTFYNLKTDDIPFLSFGISVKNEERYKKLFYFINYFMLENYINESIEQIDEYINIEQVFYGGIK